MSAFLIYLTCSFLFVIFYITRDEIRRARDKRSGALVKRLPRSEPWVWSIYIPLVGGMNIYMFTHLAEFQTIVVIFAVIGLLFGLIGMYYYETKYLRFNPDNTITYRGLTGKLRTTPITAINEYQYTPESNRPDNDGTNPDSIWLWNDKGYTIAAYSPRGMKEYTIPAHLYFRCTQDRWADPNNPHDMQQITWAIEHYPRVIDFLTANPRITGMATGNIEPKLN